MMARFQCYLDPLSPYQKKVGPPLVKLSGSAHGLCEPLNKLRQFYRDAHGRLSLGTTLQVPGPEVMKLFSSSTQLTRNLSCSYMLK